jgi:hypothetical protein
MSQENVGLLRLLEDRTNRGRMSQMSAVEIRSLFHPDVEFLPLSAATEGTCHGIAGIETFVADNEAVFEEFETHYEYLDLGERVLTWGTLRVKARQSGIDTDIPVGGLVEFREGKIVRWQVFGSKDEALKSRGAGGVGDVPGERGPCALDLRGLGTRRLRIRHRAARRRHPIQRRPTGGTGGCVRTDGDA